MLDLQSSGLRPTKCDVVAWGYSDHEGDILRGTSFAAPRVSRVVGLCAAAILELASAMAHLSESDRVAGIPLVGVGVVDSDLKFPPPPRISIPALQEVQVNTDVLVATVGFASSLGQRLRLEQQGWFLKQMVLALARPVEGFGPMRLARDS